MIKLFLFGLVTSIFADTIYLNKSAIEEVKKQIVNDSKKANVILPEVSKELKNIKIDNLDLKEAESQIEATKPLLKVKPLSNKLPNGQKYYLYSESFVNDTKRNIIPIDINQTISDFNSLNRNAKNKLVDNRLLIFISSSMPKATIINLMRQASPLEAIFVVRGLINGSFVNTYKYFFNLKGDNSIGIMLNPTLFKAMNVEVVPTFALYKSDKDLIHTACTAQPEYVKVSGETSVHYALEQLHRSLIADLSQIASNELDILDSQRKEIK